MACLAGFDTTFEEMKMSTALKTKVWDNDEKCIGADYAGLSIDFLRVAGRYGNMMRWLDLCFKKMAAVHENRLERARESIWIDLIRDPVVHRKWGQSD